MSSFRVRITSNFLFLIALSVLSTGIFVAFLLRSSYLGSLEERLFREGKLIADTIVWNDLNLQREAELYAKKLEADVIFLSHDQRVLGSYGEATRNKNLLHVEEIQQALQNKPVSPKINQEELFVAIPVIRNGGVVGVLQLAIQLDVIGRSLQHVWISLAGGLLIAFGLAAIASSRIASGVTRPLEEISRVAADIAQKRFYRRVREEGNDEIGKLGRAINRMASSLEFQVETIRRSERRLKSVIEAMESGLILVDPKGKINLVNRAIENFLGIPAQDLIGLSVEKVSYPEELQELIQECTKRKVRIQKEFHLYYPQEKIIKAHFTPMLVDATGVGVVVVFHDLTEVRRLEKVRQEFVANVSHELKTPITSIRGFAETLLDGNLNDPVTVKEFLQIIYDESIRLEALVSDILKLSQIESKRLPMKFQQSVPAKVVESVLRTLDERFSQKEQIVIRDLEHFPATIDPERFRQIVQNLVANASTYTQGGGKIKVQIGKQEERFFLRVQDTGIGIPASDLPRIFERFYRVDKARSRNSGGTGLGLAIVKHLVEEHQGFIEVNSRVGEGTTFTVWFPLSQDQKSF